MENRVQIKKSGFSCKHKDILPIKESRPDPNMSFIQRFHDTYLFKQ